jgi:class 3 adenylate cyclase
VTDSAQRVERAITAFVRQEFGAPIATIMGLTEILIEDARSSHDESLASDLDRIHSAGRLLQEQLDRLVSLATQGYLAGGDAAAFRTTLRHDLRTPLNAVKGYSELILEEARENGREDLQADITKLVAAAEQLLGQVDRLVGLTEETKSSDASHAAGTPPRDLVGEIMRSIEPIISKPKTNLLSGRILVVDDTDANRDLLSRRLRRQGHAVDIADGGRSALEALSKSEFDLILLDLMMPDINGLQVLTWLKANPRLQHIPVIMISALDEIDSTVRCIELGAEDYIAKPFDPVLLGARIEASLERKRLRDRERAFTNELRVEKTKTEALLHNILPATIVSRIRKGEIAIADRFPDATILFADLVDFTDLASRHSPGRMVELLNGLFSEFDKLAKRLHVEKIKTIGDAYMAAGGLPEESPDHAVSVAEMALGMIDAVREVGKRFDVALQARVGIHSGEVVAGLIGQHRSIYDVWGDTVNIASRLESSGLPNRIQISESTYQRVKDGFYCELRGPVLLKGKGTVLTYFLGERVKQAKQSQKAD